METIGSRLKKSLVRHGVVWLVLGMCLGFLGCGGSKSPIAPIKGGRTSGDALAPLDCREEGLNLTLEQGEIRHVPAEELAGRLEDGAVSFCGVMRSNPDAKLALFQFTSLECYGCQKWIERLYDEIEKYGLDIIQIPVLTGKTDRVSAEDMKALKANLAPEALWMRDSTGELWKFFTPDPTLGEQVQPLTVAMDAGARGFFCIEQSFGLKQFVETSNTLMKVGLAPVGP